MKATIPSSRAPLPRGRMPPPHVGPFSAFGTPWVASPLFSQSFLFSNFSFVLHLALATIEHEQIRAILCDSELHLRVIHRLLISNSCSFFDYV
jgi:hypothetical protein